MSSKDLCPKCTEEDKQTAIINWISCTACDQWYHLRCVSLDAAPAGNWYCTCCEMTRTVIRQTQNLNLLFSEIAVLKQDNVEMFRRLDVIETKPKVEVKRDSLERAFGGFDSGSGGSGERGGRTRSEEQGSSKSPFENLIVLQEQMLSRQFIQDLPDFDGNPSDWPLFYSQFLETTRQGKLNDAYNVCRLRKSLKGPAMNAVKGALSIPDNLCEVLNILKKRFGNDEMIAKKKLKDISDMQGINEAKPRLLKKFFELIKDLVATLTSLGADGYLESPQTLNTLIDKLSPALKRKWLTYSNREVKDLDLFVAWLEPFYNCAILTDVDEFKKKAHVNVHQENESTKDSKGESYDNGCTFCKKKGHEVVSCHKFKATDLKRRWEFLRRGRWCFLCMKAKHWQEKCPDRKECGVDGCKEFHHILLHKKSEKVNTVHSDECITETFFQVVPVKVLHGGVTIVTWAFLDNGSSITMLSGDLAKRLNVSGPTSELCLSWTNGSLQKDPDSQVVSIEICGFSEGKKFHLKNVRTVSKLVLPRPNPMLLKIHEQYDFLKDVVIPEIPISSPGILIGLEHSKLMLGYDSREGKWDQPVAVKTRLGWTIYGKSDEVQNGSHEVMSHICECSKNDSSLHEAVKQFFSTESFGVKAPLKVLRSVDDMRAREIYERTIKKIGDRYEIGLLWKNDHVKLPDNRSMAYRRLLCFESKLRRDPELLKQVNEKIASHIEKGYLKEVSDEELSSFGDRKWYLPIFAVKNPNKPGSFRLVMDAAAEYLGVSLNTEQVVGDDQVVCLQGVLYRFREGKFVAVGDVSEMYHRVKVPEDCQQSQLVLWRNGDRTKPVKVYKVTVLTFGSKSSPGAAKFVKDYNALKYKDQFPEAVTAITRDTYVDDLMFSWNDESELIKIVLDIVFINAQAGFHIKYWMSNSPKIVERLNKGSEVGAVEISITEDSVERVLGLFWRVKDDCFVFKLNLQKVDQQIINHERSPTKREMLRLVMSIYDPLGFLVPLIIPAKVLIQEVWRHGVDWDEKVPTNIQIKWKNWIQCLESVKNLRVPRYYGAALINAKRIELHLFSDAGEMAFCSVAFLRIDGEDGNVAVAFVAGKSKVAPQKSLSIPRLELQGAVMSSRLAATIRNELSIKIHDVVYWTDSKTVLGWLRSDSRNYSPFVAHRISEVLDVSNINQWNWLPSKENVADDGTKWAEIPQISKRWLRGPSFLQKGRNDWPKEGEKILTTTEEKKAVCCFVDQVNNPYHFANEKNFSNWSRLLRCIGYVIKYVRCLRSRIKDSDRKVLKVGKEADNVKKNAKELIKKVPGLNGDELKQAEFFLLKKCQFECFLEEIDTLKKQKPVTRQSSIFELTPILDDGGLIRVNGRLASAPSFVSEEAKFPVLLGHQHYITHLIINATHKRFHHYGRELVVGELRQRFWIPKIRTTVNQVVMRCNLCRYYRAKPRNPKMADLPKQRLGCFAPPFTFSGLDYFGPIEVTIGRRREKRYGAVFCCLTTRAVHIEMANTLNTNSCIMVVRNFINRRGPPQELYSDNGTNMKGAERELREAIQAIDFEVLMNETQSKSPPMTYTKWIFIPPTASHFGGIWERCVGLIKRPLYKMMKSQAPQEETLRSLLIEIENIVNSRPLYYSSSADSLSEPAITPNHFIRMNSQQVYEPGDYKTADYRRQWRLCQELAQEFWKKWLLDYLPHISQRSKWFDDTKPLNVGDLVLMIDDNLKRNEWRRGIVVEVHPGADGRVRSATVKTATSVYVRPVVKLAVIELDGDVL